MALRWNRRCATIFYADGERKLWSVPVSTHPVLHVGAPTPFFTETFDVSPDGKQLLMQVPEVSADQLPLTVIVNWPAAAR
jgi:hypothetical protein